MIDYYFYYCRIVYGQLCKGKGRRAGCRIQGSSSDAEDRKNCPADFRGVARFNPMDRFHPDEDHTRYTGNILQLYGNIPYYLCAKEGIIIFSIFI